MELSKPPKDILGLGKHLVRELNFEDGVDTLGRWMSHHLAELIYKAENGKTPEERLQSSQQAVETILKIWEHRKNLPRQVYPLAEYNELLKVINRLRIDSNPYFYGYNSDRTDNIASMLFDNFTRLILGLLLMKAESVESRKKVDNNVVEFLDEQEKQIWSAIQEWMTIFPEKSEDDKPISKKRKSKKPRKNDLKINSLALIKNITDLLNQLSQEIQK